MLLLVGAGALTVMGLWLGVGSKTLYLFQGRYLIPLLALVAATWCSAVRVPVSRWLSRASLALLVAVIVAEYIVTDLTISAAYQLF